MKIRTLADIEALEQTPLGERIRQQNVLELLQEAALKYGRGVAIRYLAGTGPEAEVQNVNFLQLLRRTIQTANLLRSQGIGHTTMSSPC
jgi:fatty-acyl-CoA synthase